MQPTMKLRLLMNNQSDGVRLQQWHEHTVSIPIDGVVTEQVVGEWRDVEIVTE